MRKKEMAQVESDNQLEIVKPIVNAKDAISDLQVFEELKTNLLSSSDYQAISGKNFIKKSGWRKLALVFSISDQIMESSKLVREDGSFLWTFRVRASAPNGRFTEAVGSCDSRERNFAHVEHDVYATAHTRAKSRAISDLIGAGEISAEELDFDSQGSSEPRTLIDTELSDEEAEKARNLLKSASAIFRAGGEGSSPMNAESPNGSDANEKLVGDTVKKFELAIDGKAFHIAESEAPFSRFFIGKICKSVAEHNPGAHFQLEKDERGRVSSIVWHNLPHGQEKEIANTLLWSLKKVAEKRKDSSR
jgi:hypothetical protein